MGHFLIVIFGNMKSSSWNNAVYKLTVLLYTNVYISMCKITLKTYDIKYLHNFTTKLCVIWIINDDGIECVQGRLSYRLV